jgi:hypothetical protein
VNPLNVFEVLSVLLFSCYIRDLRHKRSRISSFEIGRAVVKTEDDRALLGSKANVLQELKKSEAQLLELKKSEAQLRKLLKESHID